MDAFSAINSMASASFTTTTGFTINALTSFATSTFYATLGAPIDFLNQNIGHLISWGLILLVLSIPLGAVAFYKL